MEHIIQFLQSVDPLPVYCVVFSIAFIENIFPPSPSDLVVVFAGSLVGLGRVGFVETLFWATVGSALGFLAMYKIGDWFGVRILERGRIRFIPVESVRKVEEWFRRWGYWIIVANRFLAGTRAVVSFFAGMSELRLGVTLLLSGVSALAWNFLLVLGGYSLGHHWRRIGWYLTTYGQVITGVILIGAAILIFRTLRKKNNSSAKV